MQILGVQHLKTTAYHPQANGMVERWHRTVKTAIKCHATEDWCFVLSIVLLGLRAAVKEDSKSSPAEMVFGSALRLPGEFFQESRINTNSTEFVKLLRRKMQLLKPNCASRHHVGKFFMQPSLKDCSYVFVRSDHVRAPLEPPYTGPFEVIAKSDKYFKVQLQQRKANISIDRLKAAYVPADYNFNHTNSGSLPHSSSDSTDNSMVEYQPVPSPDSLEEQSSIHTSDSNCQEEVMKTTRSGRHVHFPARYL
ncbi:uncharacterized protein LOC135958452 [Calliphora vicina]|uniref:uncharacterized protein LOC135958452 n=1 Tax=Calliphora vicina TaxID=7373 RepID=UPI00325B606D